MLDTSVNNKRIAKNTLFLYIRMMIQLLIGLYTSRVILHALGITDFGIYNVIGGVVAIFSFISGSMNTATNRYLAFELGSKNFNRIKMRQVFCTALVIHFIIVFIFLLLSEIVGIYYINNLMVLPVDKINTSLWLLQFSLVTCMVQIISVPYNAAIVAHERMGAFAYIAILEAVLQLSIALYIDNLYHVDRLLFYGLLIMLAQIIIRIIYGYYCARHFEETKGKWSFDRELSKEITKFAFWIMNGSLAVVGYTQGLNLLLNYFFGPAVNAARGLAVTIQTKMMAFCANFQTAVTPQIIKNYSDGRLDYMHSLIYHSSIYSYYLVLLLSLPIIIETKSFLSIWLIDVPEYTVEFVRLSLCVGLIESLRSPLNSSIHATGNIKRFQLIEGTANLLIFPLSWFSLYLGGSPVAVFIVQLLMFIFIQGIRVKLVCPVIGMRINYYVRQVVWPIMKVTLISVILPVIFYKYVIFSRMYINVLLNVICSLGSVLLTVWLIGIDKNQRIQITKYICKK